MIPVWCVPALLMHEYCHTLVLALTTSKRLPPCYHRYLLLQRPRRRPWPIGFFFYHSVPCRICPEPNKSIDRSQEPWDFSSSNFKNDFQVMIQLTVAKMTLTHTWRKRWNSESSANMNFRSSLYWGCMNISQQRSSEFCSRECGTGKSADEW